MKISEFIKYLEDQKTIHGDIEVVLSKCNIKSVYYQFIINIERL